MERAGGFRAVMIDEGGRPVQRGEAAWGARGKAPDMDRSGRPGGRKRPRAGRERGETGRREAGKRRSGKRRPLEAGKRGGPKPADERPAP